MSEAETIFSAAGGLGHVVLNRPKVLNAISPDQFGQIDDQLAAWADDDAVRVVMIEGAGERAFCAGGDIRAVYDGWRQGDHAANRAIFRREYRMDRRIAHYSKPYVALIDGITMGGGAGVSVNGRYRVATERTQFAMPETGIGFFPDVGATHFLGRCPGRINLYLGLTGARIGPADALWAGLATHYVPSEDLPGVKTALASAANSTDPDGAVAEVLARAHSDPGPSVLAARAEAIDRCFAAPTVRDIVSALVADGGEWAWDAMEAIADKSPTSLGVTLVQLRDGHALSFDDAIRREYRLACRFLAGRDLYEGIRALVVDKDRSPAWSPETLAEVDDGTVQGYFSPLLGEDELPLP
ncbi:MAG: enoyl-CoA hydratase/isomerase family protein [Actinomycetota bacterium]